ncbi:ABC transporter ATP-binding protein [uncultured Catenibacterium sp.]|uniref:ABC transporter ATP-binding protein n=1 Tax=uncultured Catenibacterium sp. TaxID=286142 RepID=UPI00260DAC76|nr:ABC transporter ATP-binding protein [uncultured Catenibacterium sp.]
MKNNRGNKKNTFTRLIKTLFEFYPVLLPVIIVLILFNSVVSSIPSVFMQNIIAVIEKYWRTKNWAQAQVEVLSFVSILAILYILSLIASLTYNRLMAVVTQGSLMKFREKMFARMESLPIRYFDTNAHGDIMSIYTNDTDTLRQLISQSLPALMQTSIVLLTVFCIMIYYSLWLTGVVLVGCVIMFFITKNFGSKSSRFFIKQQQTLGATEGYIEEMMNGQKVIKVFNHEEEAIAGFDEVNNAWFEASRKANTFANILMPVLHNMGNILYVLIALTGGILLYLKTPNVSLSGMALNISIVVPFLNMTKQFTGQIGQISQQINSVVMGLAGASRIFGLLDEEPEFDEGYVTLVNAKEENGELVETTERTEMWAWKHPHEDGTVTYTRLEGDVEMHDVDFAYNPNKMILHNITLYAKPGQKVAFVGATGAGKTTITNLINRFYDIEDGKIRYDGININKIKKPDLRRSLGIILQDTNLFTGTVMDNIRYGYLEATDEQCIEAAKLAGADDFITRLPDGYNTMLTGNGASLSQGQRQLIAIARAAVADPPVMIMDEATSSIDTRTEAIVQKGMDALMKGRTVFVIAHRLSTVQNSDVIMVLDHGHIIERGSHEDLIKQKGQYYQLYTGAFELE